MVAGTKTVFQTLRTLWTTQLLGRSPAEALVSKRPALWTRRILYRNRQYTQARDYSVPPTRYLDIAGKSRTHGRGFTTFNRVSPLSRWSARSFHTSRARMAESGANSAKAESLSLSGRLKKLSREYGWSAVGVYFALSVLDFPFCFLLLRTVGTERVAEVEHFVVGHVEKIIPESIKKFWHEYRLALKQSEKEQTGDNGISDAAEMAGWGVKEAEVNNAEHASLATQLALAYAIHKSFIFLRVPLTAAVTPKVVKTLRSWGWEIGKRKPRT